MMAMQIQILSVIFSSWRVLDSRKEVCSLVTDASRMAVWQHSQQNSASSFTTRRCTVSLKMQCLRLNVQLRTLLMLILVVLLKNLGVGRHHGLTRRDAAQQTTTVVVCCHWMRAAQRQVLKLMSQPPAPPLSATVVSRNIVQHLYSSFILYYLFFFPFNSLFSFLPLSPLYILFLFLCGYVNSNTMSAVPCMLLLTFVDLVNHQLN